MPGAGDDSPNAKSAGNGGFADGGNVALDVKSKLAGTDGFVWVKGFATPPTSAHGVVDGVAVPEGHPKTLLAEGFTPKIGVGAKGLPTGV